MEELFEVIIPADDDGYITIQCPFCKKTFKLAVVDFEEEPVSEIACAHCGLWAEKGDFISDDAKEKVLREAENKIMQILGGTLRESGFKLESNFKENAPKQIVEPDMDKYSLVCCEKSIKANLLTDTLYCPFCGGLTNGVRNKY